jgi:hypothetical protein
VNAQDATNIILVDFNTESQRDLLSKAGAAPAGIAPFHCYNGVNEVFPRSLRPRPVLALGRKQQTVLPFCQHTVEMKQSGRLQNDGGPENACRADEKSAQAGDDTICGTQVGCTLSTTIEDQKLMSDQHGFGDDGTESARLCQSGQSDDQMNE